MYAPDKFKYITISNDLTLDEQSELKEKSIEANKLNEETLQMMKYTEYVTISNQKLYHSKYKTPTNITKIVQRITKIPNNGKDKKFIKAALINTISICNKPEIIIDYCIDLNIDLLIITETWLSDENLPTIACLTKPPFNYLNFPRMNNQIMVELVYYTDQI